MYTQPPPDIIDGEEQYEVEAIINHKVDKHTNKLSYLVKWLGYPLSDATWEDESDVHADDLVKKYKASIHAT
jgi:hypothetical protein